MQWIPPLEGCTHESQRQKTSSQEEHTTNNVWEEIEKEDYRGGLSKRMEQGKSSPAFSVENQVTLQEIAGKNTIAIKVH
jgi:hypothetical protein